jgi:hypothetical protein
MCLTFHEVKHSYFLHTGFSSFIRNFQVTSSMVLILLLLQALDQRLFVPSLGLIYPPLPGFSVSDYSQPQDSDVWDPTTSAIQPLYIIIIPHNSSSWSPTVLLKEVVIHIKVLTKFQAKSPSKSATQSPIQSSSSGLSLCLTTEIFFLHIW